MHQGGTMKNKYLNLMSIAGFFISLDQLTKLMIYQNYKIHQSTVVIQDFFNITYVRNFGAAFGFLADSNPAFRDMFFLIIPPIALVIILAILKGVDEKNKVEIIALSCVFGGAIGNYIDRLRFGFVVDFLDFHYKDKFTYPAFNVADIAIVIGISILFLLMLLESIENHKAKQQQKG